MLSGKQVMFQRMDVLSMEVLDPSYEASMIYLRSTLSISFEGCPGGTSLSDLYPYGIFSRWQVFLAYITYYFCPILMLVFQLGGFKYSQMKYAFAYGCLGWARRSGSL